MRIHFSWLAALIIASVSFGLQGCKPKAPEAPPPADSAPPPATVALPAPPAPAGAAKFDIDSVPVTTAALPPFPFLEWPAGLTVIGHRFANGSKFDRAYVIAGTELRPVEGRIETRKFALEDAQLSRIAAERNYDEALKALGATVVNKVQPDDPAFVAANGGDHLALTDERHLRMPQFDMKYTSYLIRTPQSNIWVAVSINDDHAGVLAVEEKALTQSIGLVSSDKMQAELEAKGRVALYINFDTDRATIKPDAQPTLDEIVKLLRREPSLKLSIEGHTDNSGDAHHNKELSRQRAGTVAAALAAAGIDQARLAATGWGDQKPLASNGDDTGRAANRRVELVKRS